MKISFDIKNCQECPFLDSSRSYSTDGWDRVTDWTCKRVNKSISKCIDWHEESKIPIPEWCPIKSE